MTSGQTVIYTAVFGGIRDDLSRQFPQLAATPTHVYTDRRLSACGWQPQAVRWQHSNPRLLARRHKILSHLLYPQASYTWWLDGCFVPLVAPARLIEEYLGSHDMCLFAHPQRDCLYQELEACIKLRKDLPQVMTRQVERYRQQGYPQRNGLVETGVLLRRHTPEICRFNELWWAEVRNGSVRDQLSFNYVCWKLGVSYAVLPGDSRCSPYVDWRPHR